MRTDHRPLLHDLHLENMKSRHHRWEEQLQLFDIQMEYRQGREHIVPDALSCRPDHRPLPSKDDNQVDHTNRDQQPREVATITKVQPSDTLWDELREACHNDAYYRTRPNASSSETPCSRTTTSRRVFSSTKTACTFRRHLDSGSRCCRSTTKHQLPAIWDETRR
jgi:hypothetical protein